VRAASVTIGESAERFVSPHLWNLHPYPNFIAGETLAPARRVHGSRRCERGDRRQAEYSRNSNGGWKLGRFSGKCDAGFREMASFVSNQFARPVNATPSPRTTDRFPERDLPFTPNSTSVQVVRDTGPKSDLIV